MTIFRRKGEGVWAESKKSLSEKTEVVKKGGGGGLSFLTESKKAQKNGGSIMIQIRTLEVLDKYQKDFDEDENEGLSAADCGRQGMLRLGRAEDRSAIDGRGTAR